MSAPRLFVKTALTPGSRLALTGDQGRYIGRVLRSRPGDTLRLFDGSGLEFSATVEKIDRNGALVAVGTGSPVSVESPLEVRLAQVVARGDRMDFVVQKATELGVRRITPLQSDFSVVKLGSHRASRRQQHWQRVSESACEQCGRNVLPVIDAPLPLVEFLSGDLPEDWLRLVLTPRAGRSAASLPRPATGVVLLVGPEGGFSAEELQQAERRGYVPVGLGPRILRTETAALAALTLVQVLWGDLAPGAVP